MEEKKPLIENPMDVCLETCHPDDLECFKECVTGEEWEEEG